MCAASVCLSYAVAAQTVATHLPETTAMTFATLIRRARSVLRSCAAGIAFASTSITPALAADVLYATGGGALGGALSGLHEVDPQTGANHLLWGLPSVHLYNGGLAYDTASDALYATGAWDASTGTSTLFRIDRFTGALSEVGPMGGSSINLTSGGLAVHPLTGVMYATGGYNDGVSAHQSTGLFTVDKTNGAATLIGFAGGNCCVGDFGVMLNGLGFRSDGTLFANGWALGGPSYPDPNQSHLYTVNLATGAATHFGPSGVTLGRSLKYSGLAFSADGTLLSMGSFDAASGALYAVNSATGAATSLYGPGPYASGPIHFGVDGGLVFAPGAPVPEPGSVGLMLAGLAGLAAWLHRRGRWRGDSPAGSGRA